MSQECQEKPVGNTKTTGTKYQKYCYFFTKKAEGIEPSQLWALLDVHCKKFNFQLEKGKEGGYLHYQGNFSLKTKEYMQTVKNIFGNDIHLEDTINPFAAEKYCEKDETRVAGPWNKTKKPLKLKKPEFPWQMKILDECKEEPDDRKIIWVWEEIGKVGKSQFAKFMAVEHGAVIFNQGKFSDIACALPDNPKIVIFDLPRTLEDHVNYGAIEAVKNGMIFSGKYESHTKFFDSPHLYIFANFPPEEDKLSKDRWIVRKISACDVKKNSEDLTTYFSQQM